VTQPKKPKREPSPIDVSIWGIADTELLAIVDDLADENGWTSNINVRLQLGENPEEDYRSGVGSRLAWMRRYGWLEQNAAQRDEHRLTAMGHAILDGGELTKSFVTAFEKLSPAQRVRLTREISQGGMASPEEIKTALRREWTRNLNTRRR
jgi:hypothetical protein